MGNKHQGLVREILLLIGSRPDIRIWAQDTGYARALDNPKRVFQYGIEGGGDISGILPDGRRLEIEVKVPPDTQRDSQRRFQAMIEKHRGVYILATSPHEVERRLGELGYVRPDMEANPDFKA